MKIITGSSKVVQGTGETQSATVSYEFGVKGSEQKRVRDRSIVQGTVPRVDVPERRQSVAKIDGHGHEGAGHLVVWNAADVRGLAPPHLRTSTAPLRLSNFKIFRSWKSMRCCAHDAHVAGCGVGVRQPIPAGSVRFVAPRAQLHEAEGDLGGGGAAAGLVPVLPPGGDHGREGAAAHARTIFSRARMAIQCRQLLHKHRGASLDSKKRIARTGS